MRLQKQRKRIFFNYNMSGTYIVTLKVRMGMINAIVKDADNDALSCDAFAPHGNNIDVIADCASSLTSI